jgi:alanyl-tRNA synthetase
VVTGEASVGSGNRRIEAFTGLEGFAYLARERDVVAQLTGLLKTQPGDLVGRVHDVVERLRATEKELERLRLAQLLAGGGQLAASALDVAGVALVAARLDGAGGGDVRTLATDVRARLDAHRPGAVVLLGVAEGKVAVVAAVNDAARALGVSANDLVRATAPHIAGRGGGKPDLAQGGGTEVAGVDAALEAVRSDVARAVGQG